MLAPGTTVRATRGPPLRPPPHHRLAAPGADLARAGDGGRVLPDLPPGARRSALARLLRGGPPGRRLPASVRAHRPWRGEPAQARDTRHPAPPRAAPPRSRGRRGPDPGWRVRP